MAHEDAFKSINCEKWVEERRTKERARRRIVGKSGLSSRPTESSQESAAREAADLGMDHFLLNNLLNRAAPEHNPVANRVTLLEVLDRAAAQVGSSFPDQPEVEAEIRLAMGGTLSPARRIFQERIPVPRGPGHSATR